MKKQTDIRIGVYKMTVTDERWWAEAVAIFGIPRGFEYVVKFLKDDFTSEAEARIWSEKVRRHLAALKELEK